MFQRNEGIYRSRPHSQGFFFSPFLFLYCKQLCTILTLASLQIWIVPELSGRKPGPITVCTPQAGCSLMNTHILVGNIVHAVHRSAPVSTLVFPSLICSQNVSHCDKCFIKQERSHSITRYRTDNSKLDFFFFKIYNQFFLFGFINFT